MWAAEALILYTECHPCKVFCGTTKSDAFTSNWVSLNESILTGHVLYLSFMSVVRSPQLCQFDLEQGVACVPSLPHSNVSNDPPACFSETNKAEKRRTIPWWIYWIWSAGLSASLFLKVCIFVGLGHHGCMLISSDIHNPAPQQAVHLQLRKVKINFWKKKRKWMNESVEETWRQKTSLAGFILHGTFWEVRTFWLVLDFKWLFVRICFLRLMLE